MDFRRKFNWWHLSSICGGNLSNPDVKFAGWFNAEANDYENRKIFMRAMLDGYTVAKEPSWLVIGDRGYLTSLNIGKGFSTGWTGNSDKYDSGAIHFVDYQRAIDVAKLVGGEVVPVEGDKK